MNFLPLESWLMGPPKLPSGKIEAEEASWAAQEQERDKVIGGGERFENKQVVCCMLVYVYCYLIGCRAYS